MKSERELWSLLEFLEKVASEKDPRKDPCEVCIDCREAGQPLDTQHFNHMTLVRDVGLNGIDQWIECLKWILEIRRGKYRQIKRRFQP